jgi:RNase P/RNase MRP subunit POP5
MKRRYLLIFSEPAHHPEKVAEAVRSSYKSLFGELGLASSDLRLIKGYEREGAVILRCALDSMPRAILAAATVTEIDGAKAALRVLAVSGTIRGITRKLATRRWGWPVSPRNHKSQQGARLKPSTDL